MEQMADPETEAVLVAVERALDGADASTLVPVDGRDAYTLIRRLEAVGRRVYAHQLALVATIEDRRLHAEDGHRSARAMVGLAADLAPAESARRAKAARMLRDLPAVAALVREGRIGCCHVDRIARTHVNARVRDQLVAVDADLAVVAAGLRYDQFHAYLTRWEYLADEDGAADRAARDHRRRDFTIRRNIDGSYRLEGGCGSMQGTVAADIFDAYVRAEHEADWAEARARLGDDASVDDLARTDAQRRMDAAERIFLDAAAARYERTGHQIVTNLVIDQETFERQAAKVAGTHPDADPRLATWWSDLARDVDHGRDDLHGRDDADDPVPPGVGYRCSTIDGTDLDPTEAVAVALVGKLRRVVVGADGVVVDLGRQVRCFTGPRQLAVQLSRSSCYWPGCNVPATRCQSDHLLGWSDGGSTSPVNGAPLCGTHNRHRNHGFTVRRDGHGNLHVHRPDGTVIA